MSGPASPLADLLADFNPAHLLVAESDLLTVHTPDSRIVYASSSSHAVLAYAPSALLGRDLASLVYPAERPRAHDLFAAALAGAPPRLVAYRCLRADGVARWVEVHARADVHPGTAQPRVVYVVHRDLTARADDRPRAAALGSPPGLRAESRDRQELRYWQQLLESVPEVLWVSDEAGDTLLFNPHWYAYTGQRPGPIQHNEWEQVMHPADAEAAEGAWQIAVRQHRPLYEEIFRLRRHDGVYRWHLCRAAPIQHGPGWVGLCFDIHERLQRSAAN